MPARSLRISGPLVAALCLAALCAPEATAQQAATQAPTPDRDALIRSALSAAPPMLRDTVKIIDGQGNVLRQGTSQFTCLPAPPGFAGPMCLDDVWLAWLDAYANKKPPNITRMGLAYMMAGDSPDGGASNTNPYDTQPTAANDWMVDGPHVMILVPDAKHLEGIPAEHHHNGPYVMWRGTPYAHVMMPIAERPKQREVSR